MGLRETAVPENITSHASNLRHVNEILFFVSTNLDLQITRSYYKPDYIVRKDTIDFSVQSN